MTRVSHLALAICLALAARNPNADAFSTSASSAFHSGRPAAFLVTSAAKRTTSGSALFMSTAESKSALVRMPESAVELTLSVPGSATKAAYDKVCTELAKTISIPGFRKGTKIPPAVLENAMAAKGGKNALRAQAITALLNELLEPALKDEHNLEPIGEPKLATPAEEMAPDFTPGEPIDLVVRCDVWPDIDWKDVPGKEKPYFGLTGSYKRKPFDETKLNAALKDLRDRYATLEPIDDPDATLDMGDACVVNMVGYMATDSGEKGEPLPNAASGDNVEVILGEGRYMTGLVEGLMGGKVGETKTVSVSFPKKLKDKTLAGKKAIFDVEIVSASHRTIPEVTDEFAENVRAGLTAESLKDELQKAVDSEDAKQFVEERNAALSVALAEVMDVEVPDTLITNQAREKYAYMMTDMRDQGMPDDEIKKLITPENFLKYKDIAKKEIVKDFKVSMATDEIARLENIEVPSYQVDEQMESLKDQASQAGESDFDESAIRNKVESTLQRRMVFEFLAEHADLDVEFVDEEFDADLMNKLAEDSLKREEELAKAEDAEGKSGDAAVGGTVVAAAKEQAKKADEEDRLKAEAEAKADAEEEEKEIAAAEAWSTAQEEARSERKIEARGESVAHLRKQPKTEVEEKALAEKYGAMPVEERAFNILADLGMIELHPDPDAPDYDSSGDDELAPENIYL